MIQSRFMQRRPVPGIVKLRLVPEHINARVWRTAEPWSKIYASSQMPSLKPELLWQKTPPWISPEPFYFLNLFKFWFKLRVVWLSAALINTAQSSGEISPFFIIVFVCFGCFWCNPGWENVRYVERIRTHRGENLVWSKRNWAISCPAGPETPPTQIQAARGKSPGAVGRSFGDIGSVLSTFSGRREFRQTAAGASRSATDHR